jgi:hypothetical protein
MHSRKTFLGLEGRLPDAADWYPSYQRFRIQENLWVPREQGGFDQLAQRDPDPPGADRRCDDREPVHLKTNAPSVNDGPPER